jgi:hypothetical protein
LAGNKAAEGRGSMVAQRAKEVLFGIGVAAALECLYPFIRCQGGAIQPPLPFGL